MMFMGIIFLFKITPAQEANIQKIYIFVIDVSGSMRKNNLDERVKKDLKDFISNPDRSGIRLGDRVLIVGFGNEVKYYFDDEIDKNEDIERLRNEIERINFRDEWTHMSRAFDILAKRLDELHKSYKGPKYVYIYTDGKNEPPPYLHEEPITFTNILKTYWKYEILEEKNIYICMITFGIEVPEEIKEALPETTRVKYVEESVKPPQTKEITPPPQPQESVIVSQPVEITPKPEEEIQLPLPVQADTQKKVTPPPKIKRPFPIFLGILIILIIGIVVLIGLLLSQSKEKFPEDLYLIEIDQHGNEIRNFNLSNYGNKITPKKLGISELSDDAFCLFIKEGNVYLKAGKKEEIKIIESYGEEKKIEPGELKQLFPGTTLKVGGISFKYKREEI